ncbi:uncharacterized protein LOC133199693 [Saccostrea echinata]|uniref:uncharacterized protein LOC133199693 n=1 Tax=Saccostrea echinata TaxID=191078 RepID=UPI002A80485D|nr:uncharacterized protein LOC133199693 [Saccostrea echinata]
MHLEIEAANLTGGDKAKEEKLLQSSHFKLTSQSMPETIKFWPGLVKYTVYMQVVSSAKIKIVKPDVCDKSHTWFHHGWTYTYSFTASSDSAFIGASESKAGFKYFCDFHVDVPRKCEGILKVDHCKLYDREPGADPKYKETENSEVFSEKMSQNSLYFQYNLGEVLRQGIVTSEVEELAILNIKRAMLSAFQLKIMPVDLYSKEPHQQSDIFGDCPTHYSISNADPDLFYTERNLRFCQMPQIYKKPRNIFSMIQKVYGGYKIGTVSEFYYPFLSNVKCDHRVNDKHRLEEVNCLQQQIFQPSAYNGSVYASYMTNASQSLELIKVEKLSTRSVNRRIRGKKYVDILFEFEEEMTSEVTMETINSLLHKLVESVRKNKIEDLPQFYHKLVMAMKRTDNQTLSNIMIDIWNCHGNNTVNCDSVYQFAEKDYFLDALLSCGSYICLRMLSYCLQSGHVSDPLVSSLITYDLALNHETSSEVLSVLFDMCKSKNQMGCWLPLGIMVHRFLGETDNKEFQKDHPVSQILTHLVHEIGDNCKSETWEGLSVDEKINKHDNLILMFKVFGNFGKSIQKFSSVNSTVNTLVKSILICVENRNIPYHLSKTAVQVIAALDMTDDIESTLQTVLYDVNRKASIRTQAFKSLADTTDEDLITKLLDTVHTEPLYNIKLYMMSYIKGMLENDQPDKKGYRDRWIKVIEKDGRSLLSHSSFLKGKSHYIDMSRYFKLPFTVTFQGLQLEIDVVHDTVNTAYQTWNIRINYYHGKKHNILELESDLQGLQNLLNRAVDRKNGFYYLASLFMRFKKAVENSAPVDLSEMFGHFHPDLVKEIRDLFQHVNYQSNKEEFGGLLLWKVFGHEVAYADVHSLLEYLSAENFMKKGNEFLEALMYHFNKGYHRIKTRSSKIMDLTKVLPTVSGASLAMNVLFTHTTATEVKAKLTLKKFLLGVGPVDVQSKIFHKGAFEFLGQMTVTLPTLMRKRGRMVTQGTVKGKFDVEAQFQAGNSNKEVLKHFILTLLSKGDGTEMELVSVKSRLLLMHGDDKDVEEIPFLPAYHGKFEQCYNWSLFTEQQVCLIAEYPNVTASKSHAYFPLSGPFSASVTRKNSTFKNLKVVADYKERKDLKDRHIEILTETTGGKESQKLNFTLTNLKLEDYSFFAHIVTSSRNFSFDAINENDRSPVNNTWLHKRAKGVRVYSNGRHLYGFIMKETSTSSHFHLGGTSSRNKSFEISAPEFEVDFIWDKIRYSSDHIYRKLQRKLFCTKAWPSLYPLHFNTEYASKDGDRSDVFIEMELSDLNKNETSIRNYTFHVGYPGQDVEIEYREENNETLVDISADVSFLGKHQQQVNLMVNAKIKKPENKKSGYQFNILLEQKDRYSVNVSSHISLAQNIGADIDVFYKLFNTTDPHKSKNLKSMSMTSTNRQDGEKKGAYSECEWSGILSKQNWRMRANLTTKRTPLLLQQGPATNFDYKLIFVYPSCDSSEYLIGKGSIGKLIRNTFLNSRHWFNSSLLYGRQKEFDVSREDLDASVTADINLFAKQIYFKDCELSSSLNITNTVQPSWNFNMSKKILLKQQEWKQQEQKKKNKTVTVLFKAHQVTPWKFLDYQTDNTIILNKTGGYPKYIVDILLGYSNSYWTARHNIRIILNNSEAFFNHSGTIQSKISFIPLDMTFGIDWQFGYRMDGQLGIQGKFSKGNKNYVMNVQFVMPKLMNVTLTSEVQSNVSDVLTLVSEVTGSTQITNNLSWPTDKTNLPHQLRAIRSSVHLVGQAFISASKTMMTNLRKTFPGKEIPFLNMTVNTFYKNHLEPFLQAIPLTRPIRSTIKSKLISKNKTGSAFIWHLDVYIAELLKITGHSLQNPPGLMVGITNSLKRKIIEILKEGKLVWVQPFPFKIKTFLYWKETIGQRYLSNVLSVLKRRKPSQPSNHKAIIKGFRQITTFDRKSFEIPENKLECKHLLTADFHRGRFAVIMSISEISLFTVDSFVTVDNKGRLFHGDCDVPAKMLPPAQKDIQITRPNNHTINIGTNHGINLTFHILQNECHVELSPEFRNETLGLLGNPDSQKGTDWRDPEGVILQKLSQFLPAFALGGPKYCHQEEKMQNVTQQYIHTLNSDPSATPVDIVLVVPETLDGMEDLDSVLIELIQSIQRRFKDTQIGVLIYGSKDTTKPSQYFMEVKSINDTTLKQVCGRERESQAALILPVAASYPYRIHSHKVLLLLSPVLDILDSTSSEDMKILLERSKITLYLATVYQRLKNKVIGISWDNRAIMYPSDRFKPLSFPKGEAMKLLEDTSGALFKIQAIIQKDRKEIDALVQYLYEEISNNSQCE